MSRGQLLYSREDLGYLLDVLLEMLIFLYGLYSLVAFIYTHTFSSLNKCRETISVAYLWRFYFGHCSNSCPYGYFFGVNQVCFKLSSLSFCYFVGYVKVIIKLIYKNALNKEISFSNFSDKCRILINKVPVLNTKKLLSHIFGSQFSEGIC